MKNSIVLISFILCSFYYAHSQGLLVTYEESYPVPQLTAAFSQIDNPQIRAAVESSMADMKSSRSKTTLLLINNGVSVYKASEEFEQSTNSKTTKEGNISGTASIRFTNLSPHTIYKNHLDKLMLSQANFQEKEYLIEEPLTDLKWKIGRSKKVVSGYQCIKATTTTVKGLPVTAWYTPDIPVSDGPASYFGLPGLILYLDIDNGKRVYSCTSIEQTEDMPAINIPDTSEKISRAQYETMVLEMIQRNSDRTERGENFIKKGGTTIIRK